jgi:hypothetical protein
VHGRHGCSIRNIFFKKYKPSDIKFPRDKPTQKYFSLCTPLALWLGAVMRRQSLGLWEVFRKKVYVDPRDVVRLLVPAGLYTVQNNLAYFAMSHLV